MWPVCPTPPLGNPSPSYPTDWPTKGTGLPPHWPPTPPHRLTGHPSPAYPGLPFGASLPSPTDWGAPTDLRERPSPYPTFPTPYLPSRPPLFLPDPPPNLPDPLF